MKLDCEIINFIEEFTLNSIAANASPGYTWGRGNTNNLNQWLDATGSRPSNKTGVPFDLNNGKLIKFWIGNENLTDFEISLYSHEGDEINLTLLASFDIIAGSPARSQFFTIADFGDVDIPQGVQLAARITRVSSTLSNPRNTGCYAILKGNT